MRILDNMEACYGCGACFNACPTNAISMEENAEGFLEPIVDEEKCISCGKCKKVCPSINQQYLNSSEPDVFAFSAEEKVLYDSSSGGVFTFLAEHILQMGGYVVGVAFDSNFHVNHVVIHTVEDLDKIRRSKYLQSSTGETYRQTKELLEKGEYVLYSGCPCQIAGLLHFLEKDYEKLYTVDVLCHGVPSPKLFQEHLKNSFGGRENIKDVEFRSREGWASLFRVKLKSEMVRTFSNDRGAYMQSYLQDVNLRASCFQCQYSKLPRQGDITIGDLWTAGYLNLSFEYRKGVSVVLANNENGKELFHDALSKAGHKFHVQKLYGESVESPCNKNLLNENIFSASAGHSDASKRRVFFEDCSKMEFERAVHASLHKFDVGLMLYISDNYGSIATNYALYRAINDTGRKAAVLNHLVFKGNNESMRFAREHMKLCGDFMENNDWQSANQCFDTFVVGSDMSWNWKLTPLDKILSFMMFGFADETKRIISYASSFGERKGMDEDARALCSHYLKRFDAVSVREDYGVDICKELFGIHAKQVLDPVLLCGREVWNELGTKSQVKFDEEYLLAYILEPTPYKRQVILEAAKKRNKKLVVILDMEVNVEANRRMMNMDENIVAPGFIDWLAYFQHADYIITDSFHGACFSIMYRKKFVAIKARQKARFDSLAKLTECPFLFFEDGSPSLKADYIFPEIDYESVHERIELKRRESLEWLHSALNIEIKPKSDNASVKMMLQLYESLREKENSIDSIKRQYAYEGEQKEWISARLKEGKTWLEAICLKNHMTMEDSKLRNISGLQDYFSALQTNFNYVLVLSCSDECSAYWRKFVEVSDLSLRTDIAWRESYVAIVDGGAIKVDQKSREELDIDYKFVVGHPKYSVEYVNGQLKVGCEPLEHCKIKVKSKGYTGAMGTHRSEVVVDNIDYSMNRTGINMVVIDKETGKVVDSANVNTYADPGLAIHRV